MVNIEEIKNIAKKAGGEILKFYNSDYGIEYKTSDESSPLTEADLASNKIILGELEKYGWPVLSEESADDKSRFSSECAWVVDPLDGTSDFVEKTDEFCVMIALMEKNVPVLGVVYEPVKKNLYFARSGEGAFVENGNGIKKLIVSREDSFSRMKILVSRNHLLEAEIKLSEKLDLEKITFGSAGLKICKVASGEAEIYLNSSDKTGEWDTCAAQIILEEAGGKITDLKGNKLEYNKKIPKNLDGFVVSNGTRHDDIIEKLKQITE